MTRHPAPHILVVDDEDIIVSLVRDCLTEEGYDVSVASCGAGAESLLKSESIDLLVTDIRMPDFDGIELLRRAKKYHPEIGAIFMTGYANVESAKDAITEGALDYLRKPFDIAEIRSAVSKALARLDARQKQSSNAELDRISSLTRMMQGVPDLAALMGASLGFALLQCEFTRGAAVYWAPVENALAQISTDNGDTSDVVINYVRLSENPLENLSLSFPEFEGDYFVSPAVHPLASFTGDERIREIVSPSWLQPGEKLLNFCIRHSSRLCGFYLIPVKADEMESMQARFKFISLTARQTALSVENLILLMESREAYRKLQDLQEKTITLETMAARGEIAAEIGHEMKNFLGVIYGNVSLLNTHLKRGAVDNIPTYVEAIVDNLNKMKNFTDELMSDSKLIKSKTRIEIGTQIEELVKYIRPQKRFQQVLIDFARPKKDCLIETDQQLFQQLMYNILNNAADACREQPDPRIGISLTENIAGKTCVISITDNGCGIDTSLLSANFDRKYTSKNDGHGFGLRICKQIMDSHKGTFTLDSAPGAGATVTLTFPLPAAAFADAPQSTFASTR